MKHTFPYIISLSVLLLTLIACTPNNIMNAQTAVSENHLDSMWNSLSNKSGSCLTGGQHMTRRGHSMHFILKEDKDWQAFLKLPEKTITPYLIDKFADTSLTEVHTCPFFVATGGELAVYCLHSIYTKNWYDFKEFSEFKDREVTSSKDNHQAWLQSILKDPKQRQIMKDLWLSELGK